MDPKHTDALQVGDDLAARGATAPRVSYEDLKDAVSQEYFFTGGEAVRAIGGIPDSDGPLDLLTICILVLHNGFTLIGKSAPASPENFDAEKGRTFAKEDAIRQLWPLMGFALRDRLHSGPTRTARVAHEVNRVWCEFNGDASQPSWQDAPAWQRDSAIAGVAFHRANPDAGDSASHDSWMAQKVADGWTHGDVKDPEAKTHPCMVPFDQLPPEQQFKDRLFRTVVHAAG